VNNTKHGEKEACRPEQLLAKTARYHAASRADCIALYNLEKQQPAIIDVQRAAQIAIRLAVPLQPLHAR
jgi:hypothetical protein